MWSEPGRASQACHPGQVLLEQLPGPDVAARRVEALVSELSLDRVTGRIIGRGRRREPGSERVPSIGCRGSSGEYPSASAAASTARWCILATRARSRGGRKKKPRSAVPTGLKVVAWRSRARRSKRRATLPSLLAPTVAGDDN